MLKVNHQYDIDNCFICNRITRSIGSLIYCKERDHLYSIDLNTFFIYDYVNNFYIKKTEHRFCIYEEKQNGKINMFFETYDGEFNLPLMKSKQDILNYVLLI